MGVEGLESEREKERPKERSLGGDTHEWIKRALLLYKHRGMTGALHVEKALTWKVRRSEPRRIPV